MRAYKFARVARCRYKSGGDGLRNGRNAVGRGGAASLLFHRGFLTSRRRRDGGRERKEGLAARGQGVHIHRFARADAAAAGRRVGHGPGAPLERTYTPRGTHLALTCSPPGPSASFSLQCPRWTHIHPAPEHESPIRYVHTCVTYVVLDLISHCIRYVGM